MTKYFVQTSQGGLYTFESSNIDVELDPKEGLYGKRFLGVVSLTHEDVFLNIDHIVSITPAEQQTLNPDGN